MCSSDLNGAFTLSHVGWHYCQLEEWEKARDYLQQAAEKREVDHTMTLIFLRLAEERLAEQRKR